MPLVQTRGAASAQGFGEFAQAAVAANYIEDVFSTYLYTGTGGALTITNGVDLSTKGGLVWAKRRDTGTTPPANANAHILFDTARGQNVISTNTTDAQYDQSAGFTPLTTGFSLSTSASSAPNATGASLVSWTFAEQTKFFDVVTWTGTGVAQTIAHNLGSVPGCIFVKRTSGAGNWAVYHRSLANTQYLVLNTTAAAATGATWWNSTTPTSSVFSVGTDATVNASGGTYVAYVFAHDAGGFGLTGTDNVISCGAFTTDGSGNASVNLGYEPQFWLYKPTIAARYWTIYDVMRGWSQTYIANLAPNRSDAEGGGAATLFYPTATGFDCVGSALDPSTQHIYIAIRRGPMKVPTLGTSVFTPSTRAGTGAVATTSNLSFPPDMVWSKGRDNGGTNSGDFDRLRGSAQQLSLNQGDGETTAATSLTGFDVMTGYIAGADATQLTINATGYNYVNWQFRRAPGFFDEVCYTGNTTNRTIEHNLTVAPEMMIVKARSGVSDWSVYAAPQGASARTKLNLSDAQQTGTFVWNHTTPTSTVFSLGTAAAVNDTGVTYVNYLFATCPGVSKVGSYTGNGTTQTINCGFTGGARFVLLKRTDASGSWYVYDTARGMTVLTDPYLLLNSTAAEVATLGSVTTVSTGFALDSAILAAINISAGSYIFLAIA